MSQGDLLSINAVAAKLGLSVHQLRRWELMFGLEIKRGRGQQRQYRPEDLSVLERIKELVEQGWPTSQIRPQLEAEGLVTPKLIGLPPPPGNPEVLMEALIGFRNFTERRFIEISKQIDELRQLMISITLKQELEAEPSSPWQPVQREFSPEPKHMPAQEISIGPEISIGTPVDYHSPPPLNIPPVPQRTAPPSSTTGQGSMPGSLPSASGGTSDRESEASSSTPQTPQRPPEPLSSPYMYRASEMPHGPEPVSAPRDISSSSEREEEAKKKEVESQTRNLAETIASEIENELDELKDEIDEVVEALSREDSETAQSALVESVEVSMSYEPSRELHTPHSETIAQDEEEAAEPVSSPYSSSQQASPSSPFSTSQGTTGGSSETASPFAPASQQDSPFRANPPAATSPFAAPPASMSDDSPARETVPGTSESAFAAPPSDSPSMRPPEPPLSPFAPPQTPTQEPPLPPTPPTSPFQGAMASTPSSPFQTSPVSPFKTSAPESPFPEAAPPQEEMAAPSPPPQEEMAAPPPPAPIPPHPSQPVSSVGANKGPIMLGEITDQNYLTILGRALDLVGWSDEQADSFSSQRFGIPHWDELGRSQAEILIDHLINELQTQMDRE